MTSTNVLVPLYIYPLEHQIPEIWNPLIEAIRGYPRLHFIVVINPNSGPDGRPDLPDEQYQRAIPYLQGFQNVTLIGYISTIYATRDIQQSIADIDTYWKWNEINPDLGIDGIFVDEVDNEGVHFKYFDTLAKHIKGKQWKSGKPGYVVLNPGCAPRVPQYFNIADMVIVYEHLHDKFIDPPKNDSFFQYLDNVKSTHGQRFMLPPSSIPHWPERKFGVMIHDTKFENPTELKELVFDLVQVKRIGGLFITDIEIGKSDIYADWSSFFPEFIELIALANDSLLY